MTKPFIFGPPPHIDAAFASTDDLYRLVGHNCGNLALTHAINVHLGGNIRSVRWSAPVELINQAGTPAVLPAANQLSSHFDLSRLAERLKQITVPITTVGLGAQSNLQRAIPSIPAGTVNWVRRLAAHAPSDSPNIGVPGSFTMDVLDHLGLASHAVVIGCPSLFLNPNPALGKEILKRLGTPQRIAVIAGNQRWDHLRCIERSLAQLVTLTNGSYIGQAPVEMMTLTRGMAASLDDATLHKCRDYIHPYLGVSEFIDWTVRYGHLFFDVENWIEHLRRFDFVIGTRIQGVILGIQAGIPSLCIVHDSRTLELCETMKIPYVLSDDVRDGVSRDDLVSYFEFDAHEFDRNRRALCRRYVEFLWGNRLVPARRLEGIANYWEEDTVFSAPPLP